VKRLAVFLLTGAFLATFTISALASDWDVAGKVLTGVEGVRIITGGRIDPIGKIIDLVQGNRSQRRAPEKHYVRVREKSCERIWVPHYVWKKKYIPEHTEYSEKYGKIIVEGHYIKYRVENAGHWVTKHWYDDEYYREKYRQEYPD